MIIIDKPIVSGFLADTIINMQIPVIDTQIARELLPVDGILFIQEKDAIHLLSANVNQTLYSNSENSINWIQNHIRHTLKSATIDLFKDKYKFRELTKTLFPDLYYKEVNIHKLHELNINEIPKPFIIKPSVGFFSLGVHKVNSFNEWNLVKQRIYDQLDNIKNIYPKEVMSIDRFIIEENIEGEEYAFDAYFNDSGEPVILGILKHVFASDYDVSDRVYLTSKAIIEENLIRFKEFLVKLGQLTELQNFPLHTEVRITAKGEIIPIEINPLRFGAWCTTADVTHNAFGFNPYEYYYFKKRPNWDELLKNKEGKLYSLIVLDNSTGIAGKEIQSFNYKKVKQQFRKVFEIREVDYKTYPVFGFIFTETLESEYAELESILKSDLKEYIEVNRLKFDAK
jgi:hypothetical protein